MKVRDAYIKNIRTWLLNANSAYKGLKKNAEIDALHDFRVNVRRMLSYIRAYGDYLSIKDGDYRKLKKLVKTTNESRDIEVFIDWVNENRNIIVNTQNEVMFGSFMRALTEKHKVFRDIAVISVTKSWRTLSPRLLAEIERPVSHCRKSFSATSHAAIDAQCDRVLQTFRKLTGKNSGDEKVLTLHKLRIEIKRLRYLLEAAQLYRDYTKQIRALKWWQDILGEIHDISRFRTYLEPMAVAYAMKDVKNMFDNIEHAKEETAVEENTTNAETGLLLQVYRTALRRQNALVKRIAVLDSLKKIATLLDEIRAGNEIDVASGSHQPVAN